MNNIYFSSHILLTTIVIISFLLLILSSKYDEYQQQAVNGALIKSLVISVIGTIGYIYYALISGYYNVNVHAVLFILDSISIMTLLLYFLEIKNVHLSFKDFNEGTAKFFQMLLLIPTVIAIISLLLSFAGRLININLPDYLGSSHGIIRYDEALLFLCAILWALLTPFMPKIKKINRDEYKEQQKKTNKIFKGFYLILGVFYTLLILFAIYRMVAQ